MKRNIAVIGCGYWGKNLVRNLEELGALYAVCEVNNSALRFCEQNYPAAKLYVDHSALLRDAGVEAVVIATPAVSHYGLARQALLAGRDVMVEKPIALHYREGEDLVALSKEKERILMTGHVLLYHPAIVKLKRMICDGELGKINYIYSNRLNLGKFRTEENILWSFAPHDISVILHLLDEMPSSVTASGGNYLNTDVADVTTTLLQFPSGVRSHIFVSWLHPYKEQKLVVVGDKKMVLFDDVYRDEKLFLYEHRIDWIERAPIPHKEEARAVPTEKTEPLRAECAHFIECVSTRHNPLTDGHEGLRVLKVLEASQRSLEEKGKKILFSPDKKKASYFIHESSYVDEPSEIGEGTKIWHFSHVLKNCRIGKKCVLGQNVSVGPNVVIGDSVKIQNNVSVYDGVTLEDDVFCGPSMVFTNVVNPRSHWPRKDEFRQTVVRKGASLGANAAILCGTTIGRYAFVGAGSLVTKNVPDYALVYGVPARIQGWMCHCGLKLGFSVASGEREEAECAGCGRKYIKKGQTVAQAGE